MSGPGPNHERNDPRARRVRSAQLSRQLAALSSSRRSCWNLPLSAVPTARECIMSNRTIVSVRRDIQPHWVGDGFPVRSLFSYDRDAPAFSPFLLLDYAGPAEFQPSAQPRGVGEHPHRGFETVTIIYSGELAHRDSAGNRGTIGPGDVQWMTAASGVVHEEFHSPEFTRSGGTLEMVQLWVNLPASLKMSPPRYQGIENSQIPVVPLDEGAGTARVIAGEFRGAIGPAHTFTPIHLWDLRLRAGRSVILSVPDGFTTALVVQKGAVTVNSSEQLAGVELVLFDRAGDRVALECREDATALLLCGKPIDEPVVGYGPFVMNSRAEIETAMTDYRTGKMGHLE